MTQAQLAEAVSSQGVKLHPSAIAKIELRDVDRPRAIRLHEAVAIARVLGQDLTALVEDPRGRALEMGYALRTLSEEAYQMLEMASELRDQVQRLARELEPSDNANADVSAVFGLSAIETLARDCISFLEANHPARAAAVLSRLRHPSVSQDVGLMIEAAAQVKDSDWKEADAYDLELFKAELL